MSKFDYEERIDLLEQQVEQLRRAGQAVVESTGHVPGCAFGGARPCSCHQADRISEARRLWKQALAEPQVGE